MNKFSYTVCRLCSGQSDYQFEQKILNKHNAKYFKCTTCGSLQTEDPYWIDEAYKIVDLFDTGRASRTLVNFLLIPELLDILGVPKTVNCVDFGGGSGLFARLMRDVGYLFHTCDKYGSNEFATGFIWRNPKAKVSLVTMFEVAEHFPNPAEDWQDIFSMDPDWVLGSTTIYNGEGADWSYLIPHSGQHVFFYTPAGFAQLAQQFGRTAYFVGEYFLIAKNPLPESAGDTIMKWRSQQHNVARKSFEIWMANIYSYAVRDAKFALKSTE